MDREPLGDVERLADVHRELRALYERRTPLQTEFVATEKRRQELETTAYEHRKREEALLGMLGELAVKIAKLEREANTLGRRIRKAAKATGGNDGQ